MSKRLRSATAFALAATTLFAFASGENSAAFAQGFAAEFAPTEQAATADLLIATPEAPASNTAEDAAAPQDAVVFVSEPVVQELPPQDEPETASAHFDVPQASSLHQLVADFPTQGELDRQMHCLAGAIYFESRGEPLEGQLAVGRVIMNRKASSRFPDTICGVVYQKSQFSFVRGGRMPAIKKNSAAWRKAKAVAKIAHDELWESPAKGALFFHATYVNPRWKLQRVGQVNTHIFYR